MANIIQTLKLKEDPSTNVYPNIVADNIPDLTIETSKLAPEAVTNTKIHDLAVTTPKLANQSVTTDKLAVNAVTTTEIANLSITNEKIASQTITYGKLKKTFTTLKTYITGQSWEDERYFADDVEAVLRTGGRLFLIYNDYLSEVIVSVNAFNGNTIMTFANDGTTPIPSSSLISSGKAVIDEASDLSTFYDDLAQYIYVSKIAEN